MNFKIMFLATLFLCPRLLVLPASISTMSWCRDNDYVIVYNNPWLYSRSKKYFQAPFWAFSLSQVTTVFSTWKYHSSTSKHHESNVVVHMLLKCAYIPLCFAFENLWRDLVGDIAARWTVNRWVQGLILGADWHPMHKCHSPHFFIFFTMSMSI